MAWTSGKAASSIGMEGSAAADMRAVAAPFQSNVQQAIAAAAYTVRLICHQQESSLALAELIAEGRRGWFDFVDVDGSHQAPDVLTDAVLAHQLVRVGGMIVFDDDLWSEQSAEQWDPLRCPKLAIDGCTNVFFRKVTLIKALLYPVYAVKVADQRRLRPPIRRAATRGSASAEPSVDPGAERPAVPGSRARRCRGTPGSARCGPG
jgi:Methyltransferase domain